MFSSGTSNPAQFPFPTWDGSIASCCLGILSLHLCFHFSQPQPPNPRQIQYMRKGRYPADIQLCRLSPGSCSCCDFPMRLLRPSRRLSSAFLLRFHSSNGRRTRSWIPEVVGSDAIHRHSVLNGRTVAPGGKVEVIEEGLIGPSLLRRLVYQPWVGADDISAAFVAKSRPIAIFDIVA